MIGAVALGAVILYAATSWLLTVCRYLIANRAEVTQNCCGRWRAGRRALGYGAVPRMLAARPGFVLLACLGFVAAAIEMGCVHSQAPPVWGYYDQCAAENPSVLAMAECGNRSVWRSASPTIPVRRKALCLWSTSTR